MPAIKKPLKKPAKKPPAKKPEEKIVTPEIKEKSNTEKIVEAGKAALFKRFKALLIKVNDSTITPTEMRLFLELKERIVDEETFDDAKPDNLFEVKTSVLAEIIGVKMCTIADWTNKLGLKRARYGIYDLRDVIPFWRDRILKPANGVTENWIDSKERHARAKARMAEINLAKVESSVVDRDHVIEAWCLRISEFGNACKSLKYRLPPILAGKTIAEMRPIIEKELDGIFQNFKRTGKFCGK